MISRKYYNLNNQELQNINAGGFWYYAGVGVEKICEVFTHIYG